MKPVETAIARIFSSSGSIVGLGFLISRNRIMTCAHVVADAVGISRDEPTPPQQTISVDFPLVDDNRKCAAEVVVWLPSHDGTDDIAVLELSETAPESTTHAYLIAVENPWGLDFGAYGFPQYNPKGVWASGKVKGKIEGNRIQVEDVEGTSYFIEPGFSGSPVYCDNTEISGVIGMVVSAEADATIKAGFMIPSQVLLAAKDQIVRKQADNSEAEDSRSPIDTTDTASHPMPRIYRRNMQPRVVYIGRFEEMKPVIQTKRVFVAHRFFGGDANAMDDYRLFLQDGLERIGYAPRFNGNDSGTLLETICQDIINTEAGIYDVSGYNANVLIELGMSIGLNQPTVVIAEDDSQPLIAPLQQLNPLRYESPYDLPEQIGSAVQGQIQKFRQSGMKPRYCAACGLDCIARKYRQSPEDEYVLVGTDSKNVDKIHYHLKKAVKNFNLTWQQLDGNFNLTVCRWVEEVKRSRIVFFHSKAGDTRHSGIDNATTMVRTGIAIGLGVAWRMILQGNDDMPTDLKGYKYVSWDPSPRIFEAKLNADVRTLLGEARPYGGMYDPLVPVEAVEDTDDNGLIIQDVLSERDSLFALPEVDDTIFREIEADIQAVQDLLNNSKLVVVQGVGGSGKTTLIAALYRDERTLAKYKDGVFGFYPRQIRDESSMAEALSTIAAQLNNQVKVTTDFAEAKNLLEQELVGKTCLILADGIDEVPNEFGIRSVISAFDFLERTDSDILITSRVSINDANWTIPAIYTLNAFVEEVVIWYVAEDASTHAESISSKLRDVNVSSQLFEFETLIYADGIQQLEAAASSGDPFVLLVSPEIHKFNDELQLLISRHVNVLPILVETTEIPDALKKFRYLDQRFDDNQFFVRLLSLLRQFRQSASQSSVQKIPQDRYVFISASRKDSDFVERLISDLERYSVKVWFDRNSIPVGAKWYEEIEQGIRGCAAGIVVMSSSAQLSEWVEREILFLQSLQKPIIPVLIGSPVDIPKQISMLNYADFGTDYDYGLIRLIEGVRHYLSNQEENPGSAKDSKSVFIAYVRRDAINFAKQISKALESRNLNVFMDLDIALGTDWASEVRKGIEKSDLFLCVVTRNILQSEWWVREVAWALEMDKLIIPILLDGETMPRPDTLPSEIQRLSYLGAIMFRSQEFERDFQHLVAQLVKIQPGSPVVDRDSILDRHANSLITAIEPTRGELEYAQQEVQTLKHRLNTIFSRIEELDNVMRDVVLFGSLARGTAVTPLSDIDVLVIFGIDPQKQDPKIAFEILETGVSRAYGDMIIERPKMQYPSFSSSIQIKLQGIVLEVSPAAITRERQVVVPNQTQRRWVNTNHLIHEQFTQQQDERSNGIYTRLIQLFKHWQVNNSINSRKFLSGFVLECLVADAFNAQNVEANLLDEFAKTLEVIRRKLQKPSSLIYVPEIGVPRGRKNAGLSRNDFSEFASLIDQTASLAKEAIETNEIDTELQIWQRVFGDKFATKL